MARMRTIKPTFFTNEILGGLPMGARLLFGALWCLADKEGRLEDRPRRIKVEALPYDDVDIDNLLDLLAAAELLTRYEVSARRYIQLANWHKHQRPHYKEAESHIPPPPSHGHDTPPPEGRDSGDVDASSPQHSTDHEPRSSQPNRSLARSNGIWDSGTLTDSGIQEDVVVSTLSHAQRDDVFDDDGPPVSDDPSQVERFRSVCSVLGIIGDAEAERVVWLTLPKCRHVDDPVFEAQRWKSKCGGNRTRRPARATSFSNWLLNEERTALRRLGGGTGPPVELPATGVPIFDALRRQLAEDGRSVVDELQLLGMDGDVLRLAVPYPAAWTQRFVEPFIRDGLRTIGCEHIAIVFGEATEPAVGAVQ